MTSQKDLETLYKAIDKHWPYEEPHIEYSTDGYIYFRQKGDIIAAPFPIKSLMLKTSRLSVPEEAYVTTDEIEALFRQYVVILIPKVDTENSVEKEVEDRELEIETISGTDEGKVKFAYPNGTSKVIHDRRKAMHDRRKKAN